VPEMFDGASVTGLAFSGSGGVGKEACIVDRVSFYTLMGKGW
jgi:hypothetical protein